jgi:hypothetical protein
VTQPCPMREHTTREPILELKLPRNAHSDFGAMCLLVSNDVYGSLCVFTQATTPCLGIRHASIPPRLPASICGVITGFPTMTESR